MTITQKRRLLMILGIILGISLAVSLTIYALQQNINLFYTPTQIAKHEAPIGKLIRMGGLVAKNSVEHEENTLKVSFVVTDNVYSIPVDYNGILPDLFREEQGIVVQGKLNNERHLEATQVLAKHDENYMPPEVAKSIHKD